MTIFKTYICVIFAIRVLIFKPNINNNNNISIINGNNYSNNYSNNFTIFVRYIEIRNLIFPLSLCSYYAIIKMIYILEGI